MIPLTQKSFLFCTSFLTVKNFVIYINVAPFFSLKIVVFGDQFTGSNPLIRVTIVRVTCRRSAPEFQSPAAPACLLL
jgi:hypothetical protein